MLTSRSAVGLVTLAMLLAGCVGPQQGLPDTEPDGLSRMGTAAPGAQSAANVVVAVIDSGINVYHHDLRDDSALARAHPSTYIPGYPVEAVAVEVTLDSSDWETVIRKDCAVWNGLKARTLYWVPGTRVIGIWLDRGWDEFTVDCTSGARPTKGLDTLAPHGSGAAGRAVGAKTSLCPDCRLVMTQSGQNTFSMKWASEQRWIDLQSNSWVGFELDMLPGRETRGPHSLAREATEKQVVFAASGNGMRQQLDTPAGGVNPFLGLGIPPYLRPAQGQAGVIVVGGHDNGQAVLWPGTMPHVVGDVEDSPSVAWNGLEGGIFNGTSGSTPFAAGAFARIVLEARRMVADSGTGLRGGDLAVAGPNATLPKSGPLSDGRLSRVEVEHLFLHTATARPAEDQPYDGGVGCPPVDCVSISRGNSVAPWATMPEEIPAYYFIGYGQVGTKSTELAFRVLRGETEAPARPVEDRIMALDTAIRDALQE